MAMDTFKYTSMNLEEYTFRLVRLKAGRGQNVECELFQAWLDRDIIPYEAVSYTWGSQTKTDIILIQGTQLDITQNLYFILRDLRSQKEDRILWIDAICIDQKNLDERGHQVRQMGCIYNRAERVLFCLGRPTEMTHIVMTSLAELQRQCGGARWAREDKRWAETWVEVDAHLRGQHFDLRDRLRQGLEHLLAQPWFRRVWILQEVANARAALVYCGTECIPARFFALCPRLIGIMPDPHCQAVLDMMPIKSRAESEWSQGQDLYCLLRDFAGAEAQDDRDKIYALLGMCVGGKGRGTIIADYKKDVGDVIRETISYICFCDVDGLPNIPYKTIQDFMLRLSSLPSEMLEQLVESQQTSSVESLLQERGQYITVTSKLVVAAAQNEAKGNEMLNILLRQRRGEVLEAAAADVIKAQESIKHFLRKRGEDAEITAKLLKAAAANTAEWRDLFRLVRHREEVLIIPEPATGIVSDTRWGRDLFELLCTQLGEEMIQLAAATAKQSKDFIEILLERQLQAEVLGAATGDLTKGKELIKLLSGHRGTLLSLAAVHGDDTIVQLLEGGTDVKPKDFSLTPLCWAAIAGHEAIVHLLIKNGIDIEAADDFGHTPLFWATIGGHEAIVQLLIEKGADINAKDYCRCTPLWWAISNGDIYIVHLLLKKGADIEAKDSNGYTPLWWAEMYGNEAVIQLLLEKGADVEAIDLLEEAESKDLGFMGYLVALASSIRAYYRLASSTFSEKAGRKGVPKK